MKNDLSSLKVGDSVFCAMYGKGIVEDTGYAIGYPIRVRFHKMGLWKTYTIDGKLDEMAKYPTLFKERPEWHKDEYFKEVTKIGDTCIFWNNEERNAILSVLDRIIFDPDLSYVTHNRMLFKNCVKFESIEQYLTFIGRR